MQLFLRSVGIKFFCAKSEVDFFGRSIDAFILWYAASIGKGPLTQDLPNQGPPKLCPTKQGHVKYWIDTMSITHLW